MAAPNMPSARRSVTQFGIAALLLAGLALSEVPSASAGAAVSEPLRVCAEASNLPFSDRRQEGFENRIATLIAHQLGRPLQYVWLAPDVDLATVQPGPGVCDVVIAEPSAQPGVDTTVPYYWSSYVLVSRADRHLDIGSLEDPRLRGMHIGVEAIGRKGFYTPPARVLMEQGLMGQLIAFPVVGARGLPGTSPSAPDPRRSLLQALIAGRIDVAAVWGPAFGYLAKQSAVPLRISVIKDGDSFSNRKDHFGLQAMQFQISMGVRHGDASLRSALDAAIEQNRARIQRMLEDFGVPLIDPASFSGALAHSSAGPARAVPTLPGA